jgi:hypothetical protein
VEQPCAVRLRKLRYRDPTYSLLFGAGRNFGEQFIGGLAVGYEDANNNTFYNAGTQGRDHFDDDTVMGTLSFAL